MGQVFENLIPTKIAKTGFDKGRSGDNKLLSQSTFEESEQAQRAAMMLLSGEEDEVSEFGPKPKKRPGRKRLKGRRGLLEGDGAGLQREVLSSTSAKHAINRQILRYTMLYKSQMTSSTKSKNTKQSRENPPVTSCYKIRQIVSYLAI